MTKLIIIYIIKRIRLKKVLKELNLLRCEPFKLLVWRLELKGCFFIFFWFIGIIVAYIPKIINRKNIFFWIYPQKSVSWYKDTLYFFSILKSFKASYSFITTSLFSLLSKLKLYFEFVLPASRSKDTWFKLVSITFNNHINWQEK